MDTVKTYTVEEAKRKMEAFCAYQERYHQEVIQKLREMRMIPIAIDDIVVHLIQNGFLNEERFAQSFARGKFRHKKWGKVRIKRELKMRGLSSFIIDSAMQEIDNEEYSEVFDLLAKKKKNEIKENNIYKAKRKLADYLLYRGWESDLVYDKINELYNE